MDRKPQVRDVYDVRVTVIAVGAGSVDVDIVGCPSDYRSVFLLKDFAAHATLVKAAERPLAVGDMVTWGAGNYGYPLVFVDDDVGVVDMRTAGTAKGSQRLRALLLSDLRRAEPT